MQESPVDDSNLAEIVRRVVDAVDPDKIILFGSRARGDARTESDFDLMIVKASDLPKHRRTGPVYRALWGIRAPADILWYTSDEIDEWSEVKYHVATQATTQGRILYEKKQP